MPEPVADTVKPPDTSAQESVKAENQIEHTRVSQGQRKINLIWEYTQSAIAIMVVGSNLAVAVHAGFSKEKFEIPEMLANSLFLVIGFYFSRTNHTAVGGAGPKPNEYR